jgi:rhodanese-related sulfurtransferase
MPAQNSIAIDKLVRLIGTANAPAIVDLRADESFALDPRFIPGTLRREAGDVAGWADQFAGRNVIVVCDDGLAVSQGAAAWLRHAGVSAEALEGGFGGWRGEGLPLVPEAPLPARNADGRTVWVTRARPKVDRIACPWLIRRFVDPQAVFLYVPPSDVLTVAAQFGGAAYDLEGEGVFWSHRGERCTFDVMIEEFELRVPALDRLARIVRGADTARPDLAPEAAGLLAVSLGLSQMVGDDLRQLEAGMTLYDAFYRWSRDAVHETHNWPAPRSTLEQVPA